MSESPLDPGHYVEHVTRTALLLEQLARDVKALRDQTESSIRDTTKLRETTAMIERDLAVFKVDTIGRMDTNKQSITNLEERLRWLSRLVIGALVTSLLTGLVALIYRVAT